MALATVDSKGKPHCRIVLFKGIEIEPCQLGNQGLAFYTNYKSDKAYEIESNSNVAATFFWDELYVQIRFEGVVQKMSREKSDVYFDSRPRPSQAGAWASDQSQIIESPEQLVRKLEEILKKFENQKIPRPAHWGGYLIYPELIEFWFGREGRMHDRFVYEKKAAEQGWSGYMKSP